MNGRPPRSAGRPGPRRRTPHTTKVLTLDSHHGGMAPAVLVPNVGIAGRASDKQLYGFGLLFKGQEGFDAGAGR